MFAILQFRNCSYGRLRNCLFFCCAKFVIALFFYIFALRIIMRKCVFVLSCCSLNTK